MKTGNGKPNAIVVGAGASGIAMAYQLRYGLGFDNFMVSESPASNKSHLNADPYHRYMRRTLESEVHGFKTLILDGGFCPYVRRLVSS